MRLDRILNGLRRLHDTLDSVDGRIRTFDTEFRRGKHPLEQGLLVAEKGVEAINNRMTGLRESVATATEPATELATRDETTKELKRRLAKEIYRAETDLAAKLKIAGRPCDCLTHKHNLGIEALAEELIPREPDNPVYQEIIDWFHSHEPKLTVEASAGGKYDGEYPRLAGELGRFRKRLLGSEVG